MGNYIHFHPVEAEKIPLYEECISRLSQSKIPIIVYYGARALGSVGSVPLEVA